MFSWGFQFRMFVKVKGLWGHIDDFVLEPKGELIAKEIA